MQMMHPTLLRRPRRRHGQLFLAALQFSKNRRLLQQVLESLTRLFSLLFIQPRVLFLQSRFLGGPRSSPRRRFGGRRRFAFESGGTEGFGGGLFRLAFLPSFLFDALSGPAAAGELALLGRQRGPPSFLDRQGVGVRRGRFGGVALAVGGFLVQVDLLVWWRQVAPACGELKESRWKSVRLA